jgi:geranylgeranyl diphosphate synthase type II
LDNDEVRRGIPTCHKKFGEALAILAGDALLTRAFRLLGQMRPAEKALAMIRELSDAAGTQGMIGGQVVDILLSKNGSGSAPSLSTLDFISQNKTGRLIQTSAVLGALAGTNSNSNLKRIHRFGGALGLAFQVVDDIMDGDGYLRLMNSDQALEKVNALTNQARQEAEFFGKKGERLLELADFLLRTAQKHVPVGLQN